MFFFSSSSRPSLVMLLFQQSSQALHHKRYAIPRHPGSPPQYVFEGDKAREKFDAAFETRSELPKMLEASLP